jgi:hypothetical protein
MKENIDSPNWRVLYSFREIGEAILGGNRENKTTLAKVVHDVNDGIAYEPQYEGKMCIGYINEKHILTRKLTIREAKRIFKLKRL